MEAGESCDDEGESSSCDDDCTAVECGDLNINASAGEDCDGTDLGEATCQDVGFDVGMLGCDARCSYDTSACAHLPDASTLELDFSPIKRFDFSWSAATGAEYYRLRESPAPGEPLVQIGEYVAPEEISLTMPLHLRFGASYVLQACNDAGCSDSSEVGVTDSLSDAIGYFKASNTAFGTWFGMSVTLSGDGETLAVGAPFENSAATGIDGDQADESAGAAGAVYVFTQDAEGHWFQQAYIKASNTGMEDRFGLGIVLSEDGDTLAVGADGEDSNATGIDSGPDNNLASGSGAVYVFERDELDQWSQQAYIKASNTGTSDNFGLSVSMSGDGDTLAVGALTEDSAATGVDGDQLDDSEDNAGAAYVFVRDAMNQWSQQAYIKASNTGSQDNFGQRVSLSRDGHTLCVGAPNEDSAAAGIDGNQADDSASSAGAVYVFTHDGMGQWSQHAYVKASNPGDGDSFGAGLALNGDGTTLAVGADQESSSATGIDGNQADDSAFRSGAVYVFVRDGMGQWSQQSYIKASTTNERDHFGANLFSTGVALSEDGDVLAVGALDEDSDASGIGGDQADDSRTQAGAAYVFVRSAKAQWSQRAYIKASNTDAQDNFGTSISLSGDGDTLAVGAFGEKSNAVGVDGNQTDDSIPGAGAVYLY